MPTFRHLPHARITLFVIALENVGKVVLIQWALYGGKTTGRDFRNYLRVYMGHYNFVLCLADLDVWMRLVKKSNGSKSYEYILLYTNDTLAICESPKCILGQELGCYSKL